MNNEEKILTILEQLQQGQASMQGDISSMQGDIEEIKLRVLTIELVQENRILPNIQLLAEGHSGIVDKLRGFDELTERVEDIQNTVDVLKSVVRKK